jgi:hypothetical protein
MSKPMLFSSRDRTDPSPSREGEARFEFLDRVAGPFWDRLRSVIESWFVEYPPAQSFDLAQRLRADDDQHDAAWWELYLYRILTATGRRLTPHPEVPGTTKRPDFLVEEPDGNAWYLEATTIATDERGAERRRGVIIDALNSIESPDFFVLIQWRETGSSSPPVRALRARVIDWLRSLDADEALNLSPERGPRITWEHDDWTIILRAVPKSPGARGRPGRLVGGQVSAAWREGDERPREVLGAKARSYGTPPIPLMVALRTTVPFEELDDVVLDLSDGGLAPAADHRVSALLVAGAEFQAWSVNEITPAFVTNRVATHLLRADLPWPRLQTRADMTTAERTPVADTAALLGIPPDFSELKRTRFVR